MTIMLLQVLCTTSTLALGVNLPAHLVVIKGTRRWVLASISQTGKWLDSAPLIPCRQPCTNSLAPALLTTLTHHRCRYAGDAEASRGSSGLGPVGTRTAVAAAGGAGDAPVSAYREYDRSVCLQVRGGMPDGAKEGGGKGSCALFKEEGRGATGTRR